MMLQKVMKSTIRPWWRHHRGTFSALLALCAGNSSVTGESPHKGQWRRPLMFSLICVWINGWVNNRETGDLRHYRAHYDVILMSTIGQSHCLNQWKNILKHVPSGPFRKIFLWYMALKCIFTYHHIAKSAKAWWMPFVKQTITKSS